MLNKIVVNAYNFWVVVFVAIGTIASAYGIAIIGSTVGQPSFYIFFNLASSGPGYAHTTNIIGALNGVNSAGGVAGALIQAWSADYYGRRRTILFGCVVLIVGGAMCAGAVNIAMFLVGRFLAGLGSSILTCVVAIYQAEVSTPETRGAMVAVTGIMYAVGYSMAAWMGFACYHTPSNVPYAQMAFRFPLALQCLFPLIVLLGAKFIPYSPRWLLRQGRRDEAFAIVRRLHKTKEDVNDVRASQEFRMIEKQFEHDRSMQVRPFEIFRSRANRRRAATAFMLMWGNQFLGVYVLANYGVLIFANLGLSGDLPLLLLACGNSLTLFGNTWTAFYVDSMGRRRFLLTGTSGCITCLIFMAALTAEFLGTSNTAGLRATVFFFFFFVFWWCFFMDATQYVYLSEIFPHHLRSQGVALGMVAFFLSSEVSLVAAPVALNEIGWRFYLVLIVPSVIYLGIIYFFFPETKGRSLEEMGALFGDEANVVAHWYGISEEERDRIIQEEKNDEVQKGLAGESLHEKMGRPVTVHDENDS